MPDTTCAPTRAALSPSPVEAPEQDKRRRSERDERIGAQSGEALAPLPLEADRGPQANGGQEIDSGLEERQRHDGRSGKRNSG